MFTKNRKEWKTVASCVCWAYISLLLQAQGMDQSDENQENALCFHQENMNQYLGSNDAELQSLMERINTPPEPKEAKLRSLLERLNNLLERKEAELGDLMERINNLPTCNFPKIRLDPKK